MRISDWSSDVCSSDLEADQHADDRRHRQAIHLLPIFVFAEAITQFISAWLSGEWAGWGLLWSSLFTVALWPLADIVLHLPQRRLDARSEERRVGIECVSTCISRSSPDH